MYLKVTTCFGIKWSALFPCFVSVLYEHESLCKGKETCKITESEKHNSVANTADAFRKT